jgi:glutamate carboxypeptidase
VALEEGIKKMLSLNGYSSIQSADKNFRCVTSIELVRKNPSWPRNEGTNRLISCFRDAAGPLGITIIPEDRGGISDGNLLWNHLPTIDGLGPAGGNSHCSERLPDGSKDQEYAMISSFVPKALLGALGIMQIVSQGKYTGKAPQS